MANPIIGTTGTGWQDPNANFAAAFSAAGQTAQTLEAMGVLPKRNGTTKILQAALDFGDGSGTNLTDQGFFGNNGVIAGGTWDPTYGAVALSGTASSIKLPVSVQNSTSWEIAVLAKATSSDSSQRALIAGGTNPTGVTLYCQGSVPAFGTYSYQSGMTGNTPTTSFSPLDWQIVFFSLQTSGGTTKAYIYDQNGAQQEATSGIASGSYQPYTGNVCVGNINGGDALALNPFIGEIAAVLAWNQALTPAQRAGYPNSAATYLQKLAAAKGIVIGTTT